MPQLIRTFIGTPQIATKETTNKLMLGRELRLPDQLQHQPFKMSSAHNMSL